MSKFGRLRAPFWAEKARHLLATNPIYNFNARMVYIPATRKNLSKSMVPHGLWFAIFSRPCWHYLCIYNRLPCVNSHPHG